MAFGKPAGLNGARSAAPWKNGRRVGDSAGQGPPALGGFVLLRLATRFFARGSPSLSRTLAPCSGPKSHSPPFSRSLLNLLSDSRFFPFVRPSST